MTKSWDETKKILTLVSSGNFVEGEYKVTITNGEASQTSTATVEKRKVSDIKLNGTTAYTNSDATRAYIYYTVVDQYNEPMASAANISWNIGGAVTEQIDSANGKITVKKDKDGKEAFSYGTKISVTGVDATSGVYKNEIVETGLAQAIDEVEMAGFVNIKSGKLEIKKELPADFVKDSWYLLYTTKDQGGNKLDAKVYDSSDITFISEAPTLVESDFKAGKLYTINNVEYASVLVNPGMYAEKGGDVTIRAIANKTGKSSPQNFKIGNGILLSKLELSAPSKTIADGDRDVEIPFKALAEDGVTEIKNYETIVRSTNKLNINASEGNLIIRQKDNGEAQIIWHDEDKYSGLGEVNRYSNSGITNGISRSVILTAIVSGGTNAAPCTLTVQDMRRPDSIEVIDETNSGEKTIVNGGEFGIDYIGYNGTTPNGRVTYKDQYNQPMSIVDVNAFFKQASENDGVVGKRYGLCIERGSDANGVVPDANKEITEDGKSENLNKIILTYDSAYYLGNDGKEKEKLPGSLNGYKAGKINRTDDKGVVFKDPNQFTTKYSIVSKDIDGSDDKWVTSSKELSVNYTAVPLSYIKNFEITDTAERYQLLTTNSGNANGMNIPTGKLSTVVTGAVYEDGILKESDELKLDAGKMDFNVKGTTKDNVVVVIPSDCDYYSCASNSDIGTDGNIIKSVTPGAIRWNELYNENDARVARTEASKTLRIYVEDKDVADSGQEIKKSLKISDAWEGVASYTFGVNNRPKGTKIDSLIKDISVKDQYGRDILSQVNDRLVYNITNIEENDTSNSNNNALGNYAHLSNSFSVKNQSTKKPSLEGVEIGDKFRVTGTIEGTGVSPFSVDVTIGSDELAYISYKEGTKNDDNLREILGLRK